MSLISDLLHFREEAARREGIESFKVLSKGTLDAIVLTRPKNKEELTAIKGIKEAKFKKYGQGLLAIVAAHGVTMLEEQSFGEEQIAPQEPSVLSVDEFLESINVELSGLAARIKGEVSEVNIWQSRLVFFALKDGTVESTLKCSMSYQAYQLSGVFFKPGDEIIVEGFARMYKPRGELSFTAVSAEFFGEGALKKAYDELYKKLEAEGAFLPENKKTLPDFPERIALITSKDGAALGDFQTNLGRFGLSVTLYPSGVEGQRAVRELLEAVKYFKKNAERYDVLVIVRGGGSLESLQAFNNENLVRELQDFPLPVLCGIGHERDITLTALVGDQMESTPTACAITLTSQWTLARETLQIAEQSLPGFIERALAETKEFLGEAHHTLFSLLRDYKEVAIATQQDFLSQAEKFGAELIKIREECDNAGRIMENIYEERLRRVSEEIKNWAQYLAQVDPKRVLALGYSLVRRMGSVIRGTENLQKDDILTIELARGSVTAKVEKIS